MGDVKIAVETVRKVLKRSDIKLAANEFFDVERKRELSALKKTIK